MTSNKYIWGPGDLYESFRYDVDIASKEDDTNIWVKSDDFCFKVTYDRLEIPSFTSIILDQFCLSKFW